MKTLFWMTALWAVTAGAVGSMAQSWSTIQSAEYFIDSDPGEGSGTALAATDAGFDEWMEDVAASLNTTTLTEGRHTVYVRFRHRDGLWSPAFGFGLTVRPGFATDIHPTVLAGEYFLDTDPGEGLGTMLLAEDGTFDEVMENSVAALSTAAVGAGQHTLYVRMKNGHGAWSTPVGFSITVLAAPMIAYADRMAAAEYFIDNDPGEGLGTPVSAVDGTFDEIGDDLVAAVPTATLAAGPHTLYVRCRSTASSWSIPIGTTFVVQPAYQTTGSPIVSAAEYFIDNDPGEGFGTAIEASDGTFDRAVENLNQTLATPGLSAGVHTVFVRTRNADGTWSPPIGQTLVVQSPPVFLAAALPALSGAEYFVDTDPGAGNGQSMAASDGVWNSPAESFGDSLVTDGFDESGHTVFVRVQEAGGVWSEPFGLVFGKNEEAQANMPQNVSGAGRNHRVVLQWNSPLTGLPSYYAVFRGDSSGFVPSAADSVAQVSGLDSAWTDAPLTNGQTHYYRLVAVSPGGARSLPTLAVPVTAINSAPQVVRPFPDVTVQAGSPDSLMARVDSAFFDLDGDGMSFEVQSSDTSLVVAVIDQQRLRLDFAALHYGITYVMVGASDGLESVVDSIRVTVVPLNMPPDIVRAIPDTTLSEDFGEMLYRRMSSVFEDADEDSLHYEVEISGEAISTVLHGDSLVLASLPDAFGTHTIIVSAMDLFYTVSDTFVVVVTSVNDPPVLTGLPDVAFPEDADYEISLNDYVTDVDHADATLDFLYVILGSDTGLAVTIDSATHVVLFSSPSQVNDTFEVVFSVSDDSGAVDTDTLRVTVWPQNDPPFVLRALRDTSLAEDFGTRFIVDARTVFADVDNTTLTYEALALSDGISTAMIHDSLFVVSDPDYVGSVEVRMTAWDGFALAADTMVIEVTPVNDAPELVVPLLPADGDTVDLGPGYVNFAWRTGIDVDGDTLTYVFHLFGEGLDTTVTSVEDTAMTFHDVSRLLSGRTYRWTVLASDGVLVSSAADTSLLVIPVIVGIDPRDVPIRFALHPNYPNPFNPNTTIRYDLPENSAVTLRLYNILGQEVRTLVNRRETAGFKSVVWNGRNNAGHQVSTGIYILRLQAGPFRKTIRMMMVK